MTPLERAARALCELAGHNPDGPTCDIYVPGDPVAHMPWAGYRRQVRAVLAAIREPSEGMLWAAEDTGIPYEDRECALVEWRAMIDAALEEG